MGKVVSKRSGKLPTKSGQLPRLPTRFEAERDVEGKRQTRQDRERALATWDRMDPLKQRAESEKSDIPQELAKAAFAGDFSAFAEAAAKNHPNATLSAHLGALASYREHGNPIHVLMALAFWPPGLPLDDEVHVYLWESLRPLLAAAEGNARGVPGALSPAEAIRRVGEWFGLAGARGSNNAFGHYEDLVKAAAAQEATEAAAKRPDLLLLKQVVPEVAAAMRISEGCLNYRRRRAREMGVSTSDGDEN